MFLRWAKWMRDSKMHQYGERAKASYILLHIMNRFNVQNTVRAYNAIQAEAYGKLRELLQEKM